MQVLDESPAVDIGATACWEHSVHAFTFVISASVTSLAENALSWQRICRDAQCLITRSWQRNIILGFEDTTSPVNLHQKMDWVQVSCLSNSSNDWLTTLTRPENTPAIVGHDTPREQVFWHLITNGTRCVVDVIGGTGGYRGQGENRSNLTQSR